MGSHWEPGTGPLDALKRVATIESIGSSTRIEGVKLTDQEIERLLSGLDKKPFESRDEQEVAGYSDVMNTVFESFEEIPFTENHMSVTKTKQPIFPVHSPAYAHQERMYFLQPVP